MYCDYCGDRCCPGVPPDYEKTCERYYQVRDELLYDKFRGTQLKLGNKEKWCEDCNKWSIYQKSALIGSVVGYSCYKCGHTIFYKQPGL